MSPGGRCPQVVDVSGWYMSMGVYALGGIRPGGKCLKGKCPGVCVLGVSVPGIYVCPGLFFCPVTPLVL